MKLQKSHNIDSIFLPAVHAINNVVLDVVNLKYYKQSVPEKVTFIMLHDWSAPGQIIIFLKGYFCRTGNAPNLG